MKLNFEIVKKLHKLPANAAGISLRSIKTFSDPPSCTAVINAPSYGDIKLSAAEWGLKNPGTVCRARGKSLEISCFGKGCAYALLGFIKHIGFNSEDLMEALDFFTAHVENSELLFLEAAEMNRQDIRLLCSAQIDEGVSPESYYEKLSPRVLDSGMGIVKEPV